MKNLQIFATAAALLVVASAPSLAASRNHRGVDAYASGAVTTDRSGAYYYGPQDAQGRALVADAIAGRVVPLLPWPGRAVCGSPVRRPG